jgi:DNA-binding beta-propeller fold protein YncE
MTSPSNSDTHHDWALICHLNYGESGTVAAVTESNGAFTAVTVPTSPATGKSLNERPVFLGLNDDNQVCLLNPENKEVNVSADFPADAFPAYSYTDIAHQRVWFMNDGDKENGIDEVSCGDTGSSVRVAEHRNDAARLVKTICVGKGHHVTTFTGPCSANPDLPKRAYVSNLMDGTISVIGNDESDSATYLQVINTINLHQADREDSKTPSIPNNAFPHGKVFSPVTGKLYNLNNGYKNYSVIDPGTDSIEKIVPLPVSSNLLLSPCGRYLIGKGVDRKNDADHVIGRLTVVDAASGEILNTIDLPDIYPSTYRFSPDGSHLYVTTATTGKGTQKDNLKNDSILIFDATKLPELPQTREVQVGVAACGRRPIAFREEGGSLKYVFVPNPTDGTLTVLDGADHTVTATVTIGEPGSSELLFSFWNGTVSGC